MKKNLLRIPVYAAAMSACGCLADPPGFRELPVAAKREICLMRPDATFAYLHDNAIFEFKGRLFAAWYNCPKGEMIGTSVIRGRWSDDKGMTWSPVQLFADSEDGYMRVPPAFGSDGDKLYLFASRMTGPDLVRDCEIYKWDSAKGSFSPAALMGEPFLPNTSMLPRTDGRWMIAGRRRVIGDQPLRPCLAISETADVEGKWIFSDIAEETVPDAQIPWGCPETALIADGRHLTAVVRIQDRADPEGFGHRVFTSDDEGLTWSQPKRLPFALEPAKAAAGILSNGRRYLIANPRKDKREKLVIWLTDKNGSAFTTAYILQNGRSEAMDCGFEWCYPSVIEYDGELYIITSTCSGKPVKNSSGLTVVSVNALK